MRGVHFLSKRSAVDAFAAANMRQCEAWLDAPATGGEYDAVNERYGLRGRKRVATLRAAIMVCIPTARPYSLADLDLDTLNETAPARELAFQLPDAAAMARCDARPLGFDPYAISDDEGTVMFDTRAFARTQERARRKLEGDATFRAFMARVRRDLPNESGLAER